MLSWDFRSWYQHCRIKHYTHTPVWFLLVKSLWGEKTPKRGQRLSGQGFASSLASCQRKPSLSPRCFSAAPFPVPCAVPVSASSGSCKQPGFQAWIWTRVADELIQSSRILPEQPGCLSWNEVLQCRQEELLDHSLPAPLPGVKAKLCLSSASRGAEALNPEI